MAITDGLLLNIFPSGFNTVVAGYFFAIETVLRPLRAENSPPFTTAMIILAWEHNQPSQSLHMI